MLQAILQHCNGQKYNVNEIRISGHIKLTYAQQWDFVSKIVLANCEKKMFDCLIKLFVNLRLKAENSQKSFRS